MNSYSDEIGQADKELLMSRTKAKRVGHSAAVAYCAYRKNGWNRLPWWPEPSSYSDFEKSAIQLRQTS